MKERDVCGPSLNTVTLLLGLTSSALGYTGITWADTASITVCVERVLRVRGWAGLAATRLLKMARHTHKHKHKRWNPGFLLSNFTDPPADMERVPHQSTRKKHDFYRNRWRQ